MELRSKKPDDLEKICPLIKKYISFNNMKFSKLMHVTSVIVGFAGVIVFAGAILGGSDNLVFGITKSDALLCAAILILIAIWVQIATIHHMMLEKRGEIV